MYGGASSQGGSAQSSPQLQLQLEMQHLQKLGGNGKGKAESSNSEETTKKKHGKESPPFLGSQPLYMQAKNPFVARDRYSPRPEGCGSSSASGSASKTGGVRRGSIAGIESGTLGAKN